MLIYNFVTILTDMLIFGGVCFECSLDTSVNPDIFYGELWKLDLKSLDWIRLTYDSDLGLLNRAYHTMVPFQGDFILFGGLYK
jgi:hypothetical protein